MQPNILLTRLKIPKPRAQYIIRKEAFSKLDTMHQKRLTIIKGIAGSGKTTLITSYIDYHKLPVHWITLDKECNDLALFWGYVVEALSNAFDSSIGDMNNFVQTNIQLHPLEVIKGILNAFKDEEIYLILDEFQQIHDAQVLEWLLFFIDNIPTNIHIVLVSRETPTLYITKYQLQGEVLYIDEEDLLLTYSEGVDFLTKTLNLSLPKEDILLLVKKANGWIGGLQLLAATTNNNHQKITLNSSIMHTYMENEIFNHLSKEEKDFLILLSSGPYFHLDMIKELLPNSNGKEILDTLLNKNLLIHCIDSERQLYQYHPLFKEYLLQHFDALDNEVKQKVYTSISTIYSLLGDEEESIHNLLLAQNYVDVMKKVVALSSSPIYFNYIRKVPIKEAITDFDFIFQKFFYHYYIFDFQTCQDILEEVNQYSFKDSRYLAFIGADMLCTGKLSAIENKGLSIEEVDTMEMHPLTKALVLTKNAAFLLYQDCFHEALLAIEKSLEYAANLEYTMDENSFYILYFTLTLKIQICEEMGLLNRANIVIQQIKELMERNPLLQQLHQTSFNITVAGIYSKQVNIKSLETAITTCKEKVYQQEQLLGSFIYNEIEYLFLIKEYEKAKQQIQLLLSMESYRSSLMISPLLRFLCIDGDMPIELEEQFLSEYQPDTIQLRMLNSTLLYVKLLTKKGHIEESLKIVDELLPIVRKQKSYLKIVELSLQKAAILWHNQQDSRNVIDMYKEAIYYAHDNAIVLPFYLEQKTIIDIYKSYAKEMSKSLSQQEKEFHDQIIQLLVPVVNPLSDREQEVLVAIMNGWTNPQIAERLFISLPTVKSHIANIFRKLEVKSRVSAIEAAREKGII